MTWLFNRWRQRHRELDERVASAQAGAEAARAQAAASKARRELIHEDVVKPRQRVAAHNQFADMIRLTLEQGRRGDG